MFAQNLKQRIAENRTFNTHNLKPNELEYLENDSQDEYVEAWYDHDNKLILVLEMIYIGTMLMYLWQCTFEIVFGQM